MFTVQTGLDLADAALEEWDEKHQGKKKRKGTRRFAVPVDADGNPLELSGYLRDQMYRAEAKYQQEGVLEPVGEEGADELAGLIERRRPEAGYDASEYG